MKLLSKELVALDYRENLQRDLARASVCRFLVAYVSGDGMESIGRHLLNRALRDQRSFGVASLTCSCGFDPLLRLQSELPELRLKYFMDPLVKEEGEPSEISLFHSKLVYLYLAREAKSVVYIGSHNWTRRALGPQGPRNAEASIRFELDFAQEDLEGTGASVASHVNRHLLDAWNMPLCLPATQSNEPTFREWFEKGCRRSPAAPLQETTLLLAVRRISPGADDWLALTGRGIYLQVLDEDDGQLVWRSGNRVLVLVWNSDVQVYDFEFPTQLVDSSQLDGAVRPKYQFHLEVERVILPATGSSAKLPDFLWTPESFSVAASRDAARFEESPGYLVEPDREHEILECLERVLLVPPEAAKVLPYSNADRAKMGKRISTHPLHETFLGPQLKEKTRRDEYYQRSEAGALVADLDFHLGSKSESTRDNADEPLMRLQRVFTSPLERLIETWSEGARAMRSRQGSSHPSDQKPESRG